jgi:hypothetical protein
MQSSGLDLGSKQALAMAILERKRRQDRKATAWTPFPGPQSEALRSAADFLFYGGAAGGGKSDLILGAAGGHKRSIIFRREYPQLKGIIDRSLEIFAGDGRFTKSPVPLWELSGGRSIEFGAVQHAGDEQKYQGRAHDLKAFDEITHFHESQFRYLTGWKRSADAKQRTRVIATGNPPTDTDGDWIIRFWAPWLDKTHPRPAFPGELRWFTTVAGKDIEVPDDRSFVLIEDEPVYDFDHEAFKPTDIITPLSRTFIPARIEDNPVYMASGYMATLQAMPEPLRSKMLYGDFSAGQDDDIWQAIPTAWVDAAQARWRERKQPETQLSAVGVDVARGGKDQTIITKRFGNFFAAQLCFPGSSTPDGESVAQLALAARASSPCSVNVDVIGVGASVYDCLRRHIGNKVVGLNGAESSNAQDASGQLGFVNLRAEWYWKLREDLDPANGVNLAIPDDRELRVDLCAPRYKLSVRGIQIESKDDIIKRIGRSPDKGDSLVYAHAIKHQPGEGWLSYLEGQAAEAQRAAEQAKQR